MIGFLNDFDPNRIDYSEVADYFGKKTRSVFTASPQRYWRVTMRLLFRASTGFFFVLFCCLFFGVARPSIAQTDLNGYWDMRTPNPGGDGTFRDTYFEIQQSGETISGMLIRRPNGIPITGTFKDGTIHFVTVPPPPPAPPAGSTAPARPPTTADHVRRHLRRTASCCCRPGT